MKTYVVTNNFKIVGQSDSIYGIYKIFYNEVTKQLGLEENSILDSDQHLTEDMVLIHDSGFFNDAKGALITIKVIEATPFNIMEEMINSLKV